MVLLGVVFMLISPTVYGISLGISPGTISFKDVLRGGYAERVVTVSTSSDEPINCRVILGGPFKEWLSFEPGENFTLSANSRLQLKVIVKPPGDVPNGIYDGFITVRAEPTGEPGPGMGAAIATAVAMKASIEITGEEILKYKVLGIGVKDTEEKHPIEFSIEIMNEGNVKVSPLIHIDILNEDKTEILNSLDFSEKEILPTTKATIAIKIPNDLEIGKYWADISTYLGDEIVTQRLLGFDVLERGSLSIQGELIKVELNNIWVEVGEVVKITAFFRNTGVLSTPAKFKGEIYMDDRLVEIIESEELYVPVGETIEFPSYFTPKEQGRYVINGYVVYSKKITPEKGTILNVNPAEKKVENKTITSTTPSTTETEEPEPKPNYLPYIIIVVLLLALFLSWKRKK